MIIIFDEFILIFNAVKIKVEKSNTLQFSPEYRNYSVAKIKK